MTTLTMPARPEEGARLRPLPWRRMAWVTWRQHRFALGGVTVLLGALAVYLWLAGLQMRPRLRGRMPPGELTRLRHELHRRVRRYRDYSSASSCRRCRP